MKTRHKQAKDENFPVGSLLIDKKLRPLVAQYYRFARYADDIADNPKLSMKDKLLQLGEMEDVLYERIDYKGRTDRLINSFQAGCQKLQIRNLGTAGRILSLVGGSGGAFHAGSAR